MIVAFFSAALIAQCPGGVCPPRPVQAAPLKFDAAPNMVAPWCSLDGVPTTPKATRRRSSKASGQQYQATAPTRRGLRLFRRCR